MQIELRIRNVNLAGSLQSYVERRLRYALRRLGNRLGRVKVWVSDINGPRGGPDKHRRVSLELNPIGTLTAEGTHPDLYVSISGTDSYRRHDIQNRRAGCSLVFRLLWCPPGPTWLRALKPGRESPNSRH